jgi:hypothetical protein
MLIGESLEFTLLSSWYLHVSSFEEFTSFVCDDVVITGKRGKRGRPGNTYCQYSRLRSKMDRAEYYVSNLEP